MTLSFTKQGFTLIELLVVLSIILVLSALLIPMIRSGVIERDNTVNKGLMHTIENSLKLFHGRNGFNVPAAWLKTDPEDAYGNHLFYRLSQDMDADAKVAYKDAVTEGLKTIRDRYPIDIVDSYRGSYPTTWGNSNDNWNPDEKGPLSSWKQSLRYKYYNNLMKELKKRDLHINKTDYFTSEIIGLNDIGKQYIGEWTNGAGETQLAILDVYGNPFVYCYSYDPGVPENHYCGIGWKKHETPFKGVPDESTLEVDGKIGPLTEFTDVVQGGRATIKDKNNNKSLDDEWEVSDIRKSCMPGYEKFHELWSAGPDGLFHAIRGNVANEDNFAIHPDKYK